MTNRYIAVVQALAIPLAASLVSSGCAIAHADAPDARVHRRSAADASRDTSTVAAPCPASAPTSGTACTPTELDRCYYDAPPGQSGRLECSCTAAPNHRHVWMCTTRSFMGVGPFAPPESGEYRA